MNVNDPIVVAIVAIVGAFLAWQMQRVITKVDEMMTKQAGAEAREIALSDRVTTLEHTVATDQGRTEGMISALHARFDGLIIDRARNDRERPAGT